MLNAKDVETVERGRGHNFRKKLKTILHKKINKNIYLKIEML